MINKCSENHILRIAGPGGGKTHGMVEEIISRLDTLEPYRYLIVITYTNSATENIRRRLAKEINIPDNVFIGTIHSFLIKFIINSYSSLIIEDIPHHKRYSEYKLDSINRLNGKDRSIKLSRMSKSFRKKGLISFDEIINISIDILKDEENGKSVRDKLSKRIKHIFIDEYQDVCNKTFEIIDELRKSEYTHIYCVGDPEQYINSYISFNKTRRVANYKNIPFLKSMSKRHFKVVRTQENRRSTKAIVEFINNFNCNLSQEAKSDFKEEYPVMCISDSKISSIINSFKRIEEILLDDEERKIFYLADSNRLVNEISKHVDAGENNCQFKVSGCIKAGLEYIKSISGENLEVYMESNEIDYIELRSIALSIIKFAVENKNVDCIKTFIQETTNIKISEEIDFKKNTESLISKLFSNNENNEYCMTIHKSKGLEADIVMVISDNNDELNRWLETDKEKRYGENKQGKDMCRRGFVAFSRSKQILVIACKEGISQENKVILENLNVVECINYIESKKYIVY